MTCAGLIAEQKLFGSDCRSRSHRASWGYENCNRLGERLKIAPQLHRASLHLGAQPKMSSNLWACCFSLCKNHASKANLHQTISMKNVATKGDDIALARPTHTIKYTAFVQRVSLHEPTPQPANVREVRKGVLDILCANFCRHYCLSPR